MNRLRIIGCLLGIWSSFLTPSIWAQLAEERPLAGRYYQLDKQTGGIFELNIQEDYSFDLGINQIGTCSPYLMYYGEGKILVLTDSTLTLGFDTLPTQKSSYTLTYLGALEQQKVLLLETIADGKSITLSGRTSKAKKRRFKYINQEFEGSTTLVLRQQEQFHALHLTQVGAYPIDIPRAVLETIQTGRYRLELHFKPRPEKRAASYLPAGVQTLYYQFIYQSPLKPHSRIFLYEKDALDSIVLEQQK